MIEVMYGQELAKMSAATIPAKDSVMSLDDYIVYTDGKEQRYELVDGVLIEMGAESTINIQIANFLFVYFASLGVPHYLLSSKTEIVVSSQAAKTRHPDLMLMTEALEAKLVGSARSIILPEMPAPQLVIEVVSPGNPGEENYDRDYVQKRQEYEQRQIPEYWIVDPTHKRVVVLTLKGDIYQALGTFRGEDVLRSHSFDNLALTAGQVLSAGR